MITPYGDDAVDDDIDACRHGVPFTEYCESCEAEDSE